MSTESPPIYPKGMRKVFDPDYDMQYGVFQCTVCKSRFYGGGRALHNQNCTEEGYSTKTMIFFYGPKQDRPILKYDDSGEAVYGERRKDTWEVEGSDGK